MQPKTSISSLVENLIERKTLEINICENLKTAPLNGYRQEIINVSKAGTDNN